jgi:hypothetical protein
MPISRLSGSIALGAAVRTRRKQNFHNNLPTPERLVFHSLQRKSIGAAEKVRALSPRALGFDTLDPKIRVGATIITSPVASVTSYSL